MRLDQTDKNKVLIVSTNESFLAKSLKGKLEGTGIKTGFVHDDIKEMEGSAGDADAIVLFMGDERGASAEALVYLKDIVQERECALILIGEQSQCDNIKKTIPGQYITGSFTRPLDIDALIGLIRKYLDENTGDNRKKNILIVDDDITYMRTVYEWLKDSYHVGMASSGVQAISYLAKNKADLILLDYEMPVADGPQVMSMLKNDSDTGQIPVMFLTGHGDKKSVMSVIGLKPADYLLKTIDKAKLLEKLDSFFAEH